MERTLLVMAAALRVSLAVVLSCAGAAFFHGCSDDDDGPAPVPPARVSGTVSGGGPVAGATVSFVEAESAIAASSVQPIEDGAATAATRATTDRGGGFSVEVPEGRYFVFVTPAGDDEGHFPGGNFSRESLNLAGGSTTVLNIELSEKPSPSATYVGSSTCLECHPGQATAKQTLHFLGFRKLTAAGRVLSSLQDLTLFPDADHGLTYFPDGNPNDNTGPDAYGYRVPTESDYNILLGKDGTGYFVALEGPTALISEKLYIDFTYGGEGKYMQRYITRLDADGKYTADATAGSHHVLPAQFNENRGNPGRGGEVTVPGWTTYHPERWFPPAVDGGKAFLVPSASQSYDNDCAGCHFTGMALTRSASGLFQAHAAADPGGALDFDGDGQAEETNVGCERCHGPGSDHVAAGGGRIVQPDRLPPGRATMICAQCHNRGSGNGVVDGEGKGSYASRNDPVTGAIEFVRSGIGPAEFFGTPGGTGILPDFGTSGGYFNPINFATSATDSWRDKSGGHGSEFDHSVRHRQQSLDHFRAAHFQNPYEVLACFDCHDAHSGALSGQVKAPVENNTLCLRCHGGFGDFAAITQEMVDTVEGGGSQPAAISGALNSHVIERTFDLVGVAMSIGDSAYANPAGGDALGRCVTCHMPRTARSASYIVDDQGFVIEGNIASHIFDVISPAIGESMATSGVDPVPNSCVPCHRGPPRGAYPDYRYRK